MLSCIVHYQLLHLDLDPWCVREDVLGSISEDLF